MDTLCARIACCAAGLVLTPLIVRGVHAQTTEPRTSVTGDLGLVSASGNTQVTTLSVSEQVVRTAGRWEVSQRAAYVYGETDARQSANQSRVAVRADYAFRPRLGAFVGITYERNPFAGFDARMDEAAGLRWQAIVAPRDSLHVDVGGVLTQETDVGDVHQRYPSARVAGAYRHRLTATAYVQQLAEYVPDLQSGGGYRMNTESAVIAPLSVHVGIKVGYVVRYASKPPATFGTTDRVLTTGV